MAQAEKSLPAVREAWVRYLGGEDPLEEEMATLSSTLAWRIPWMEEPGGFLPGESHGQKNLAGYNPEGWKKSDTSEATKHSCKAG